MQQFAKETEKEEPEPLEEIQMSVRSWETTQNQSTNKKVIQGKESYHLLSYLSFVSPQDLWITSLGKRATVFHQSCLSTYPNVWQTCPYTFI